jgi:hypothetical protein
MSKQFEDRLWFEATTAEIDEMVEIVGETDDKTVMDLIKKIKDLLAEIDCQIMIGNPINDDKKQLNKLINNLCENC